MREPSTVLGRQEEVVRVGVRVIVVAAIVGLLVLLLHRTAFPQELLPAREAGRMLAARERPGAAQRVREAEALLARETRRQREAAGGVVVDTALNAITGPSPAHMIRNVGRLFEQVKHLGGRSPAEDQALELLEAEIEAGVHDPGLEELYRTLRAREEDELLGTALAEARQALERGDRPLGRRRVERAEQIRPGDPRVAALRRALSPGGTRAEAPAGGDVREPRAPETWEAPLAAALLLGHYPAVLEVGPPHPDAALARAVARHLSGDRSGALRELESLDRVPGETGALARHWLESSFEAGVGSGARRGNEMRDGTRGRSDARLDLSSAGDLLGFHAARPSGPLDVLGMALAVSERIVEGPRAAGRMLRRVGARLLRPHLAPARRSLEDRMVTWLNGGPEAAERVLDGREWVDGALVLPPARTPRAPVRPRPILVSRSVLGALRDPGRSVLPSDLTLVEVVLLMPLPPYDPQGGHLPAGDARTLVLALAGGLEEGGLRSDPRGRGEALEDLRRVDRALRQGWALRAQRWTRDPDPPGTLAAALIRGEPAGRDGLVLSRSGHRLNLGRDLPGDWVSCPADTLCIHRAHTFQAKVYGRLDLSPDLRVGARTSFHDAWFALELSRRGPYASLVLPLAAWLGLERWVPLEAYLEIGLDGISAGPRYVTPRERRNPSAL